MTTPWLEPPRHPPLADDALHIWRATLESPPEAIAPETIAQCAALLSIDEQARAARFLFTPDRNRYMLARGLLRHLLARYVCAPPDALVFGYTPQGKPFLDRPRAGEQLQFNVAHSGAIVLIGVCRTRRVGVDVERVRANVEYRTLAPAIFTPAELAALAALDDEAGRAAFFEIWARKEAFVKAIGEGLTYPLANFSVNLPANGAPALHLPTPNEQARWVLHELDTGSGYAAAAVSEGPLRLCCYSAHLPWCG